MNILITGGAGFIGTNAALFFGKKKNTNITLVDNLSRFGTDKNLSYLKKMCAAPLSLHTCNVTDTKTYLESLKKADVVIHLAGQTAVTTSLTDPQTDYTSNVAGGFALLEALRLHNPKAIVLYSSTNKVYGDLSRHHVVKDRVKKIYVNKTCPRGVDEREGLEFISPYGCSKGTIDQYMQDYTRSFGMRTVVFRQSCIYGPHQLGVEDQGWVAHFSKQILQNKPISLFGDGYQVRDLLFVEDLIRAYERAIQKIEIVGGMVFNVGGGVKNSFSLLQVLSILEKKSGHTASLTFQKERMGDQKYFVSNNAKAKKYLSWSPTTPFKVGVSSLISWQQNHLI